MKELTMGQELISGSGKREQELYGKFTQNSHSLYCLIKGKQRTINKLPLFQSDCH
jgi:hypothetical protein